jgi:hypothetical protein
MQPHNMSLFLQTPRAFAWQLYNLQKLLQFDDGPLRGWTPADKGIALLDYFDELEDRRVRQQVAQAGSGNVDGRGETDMCTTWRTQVWINSGHALNCYKVNSGQTLNSRKTNSGQASNCCQVKGCQTLNPNRIDSGQVLNCRREKCGQTNSCQLYQCITLTGP